MGNTGNVKEIFEVPVTPASMDEMLMHVRKGRFRIMGEVFSMSIDLHNHMIGLGADSMLMKPQDLKLITKSNKKTDPNDAVNIARCLMLHDRDQLILNPSFILKDEEPRGRCICRFREIWLTIRSHTGVNGEYLPEGIGEDFDVKKVRDAIMLGFADDPALRKVMDLYNFLETRSEAVEKQILSGLQPAREIIRSDDSCKQASGHHLRDTQGQGPSGSDRDGRRPLRAHVPPGSIC